MERYWLAWLGERAMAGQLPHAAGAESPYDLGRPWMPVEWLYATAVEWTRERGIFLPFAVLNGLAGAALLWWALGTCVARRVPGNVAFLVVAAAFLPLVERYELRAEAVGNALLVAVLLWGAHAKKRWGLVPLFAIWANVHPSFAFGLLVVALQTIDGVRRGDRAALAVFAACAAATLCNPFGIALWGHVAWVSQGWVSRIVPEWQPLLKTAPLDVLLLCVPFVSLLQRQSVRRRSIAQWALWPISSAMALGSQRFLPLATAAGTPSLCGGFRQRDLPVPRAAVWIGVATVAWLGLHGSAGAVQQLAAGTVKDSDFGLLVARSAPAAVEHTVDLRGKLAACAPGWYCNVALFLGGKTLYDGRTEPFSAARVRDLSEALSDPRVLDRWPVEVALVPPTAARAMLATRRWREVASSENVSIFKKVPAR
jgi:hypothetical protein